MTYRFNNFLLEALVLESPSESPPLHTTTQEKNLTKSAKYKNMLALVVRTTSSESVAKDGARATNTTVAAACLLYFTEITFRPTIVFQLHI